MSAVLALRSGNYSWYLTWYEQGLHGELVAKVPFDSFSSRPDPIRRAWAAVEAKRGMR